MREQVLAFLNPDTLHHAWQHSQHSLQQYQDHCLQRWQQGSAVDVTGRVTQINGILIECQLPQAKIGDLCKIIKCNNQRQPVGEVFAEVIGFTQQATLLSALGNLDGIAQGATIIPLLQPHSIRVTEDLLGQVLDGFGRAIDGGPQAFVEPNQAIDALPVIRDSTKPTERPRISRPVTTGIRSIDGLLTLGEGQRVGIFAGAGCGKTTLIAELARGTDCDVIVFGLVGERGRELNEFIEHELDDELKARTILVCAASNCSSMERARAAFTATAIAEGFREPGKKGLLLIDSITRFARAQREIGLAAGEPAGRGGFPSSFYTLLSRLVERSGITHQGSITALYTVLIEQDSMNDPVADEVRSLLDGHIVLSRKLAEQNHYPAVDVLASLSRTMVNVTASEHQQAAARLRQLLSAHKDIELMIKLGEYQSGHDAITDEAVERLPQLKQFLQQPLRQPTDYPDCIAYLQQVVDHGAY